MKNGSLQNNLNLNAHLCMFGAAAISFWIASLVLIRAYFIIFETHRESGFDSHPSHTKRLSITREPFLLPSRNRKHSIEVEVFNTTLRCKSRTNKPMLT